MKKNNLNFSITFACCLLISPPGFANTPSLVVAFSQDRPPFIFGETKKGLEIDIVREALKDSGLALKVKHMSNERLHKTLKHMKHVDAIVGVSSNDQHARHTVDELFCFENVAISRAEDRLSIEAVEDLKGLKVAAWQGAYRYLPGDYHRIFHPSQTADYMKKYREVRDQVKQNAMFWNKKIQVIVLDKTIFSWHRQQLTKEIDTQAKVVYHNLFENKTCIPVVFADREMADIFQVGLDKIKKSGRYAELFKPYTQRTHNAND